jgi:hypothetical protein
MSRIQDLLVKLPQLQLCNSSRNTFSLFSELPTEIQNAIWRFVAIEPRTIKVFHQYDECRESNLSHRVDGQPRTPAVLQTSRHARQEGLRYYSRCYDTTPFHEERSLLYVNFDADFFCVQSLPASYTPKITFCNIGIAFSEVQHLELPYFGEHPIALASIGRLLSALPNIGSLNIILQMAMSSYPDTLEKQLIFKELYLKWGGTLSGKTNNKYSPEALNRGFDVSIVVRFEDSSNESIFYDDETWMWNEEPGVTSASGDDSRKRFRSG